MSTPFDVYLAQIAADVKGGKATEYTHRSALEHLIEALGRGGRARTGMSQVRQGNGWEAISGC